MIQLTNSWIRILLIVVLIFSVSLPIYKKETSDFALIESGIEGITKKISTDAWSFFSESATALKDKLFEKDKPIPLTAKERFFDNIRTGWHYGLSSVGATEKVLRDSKFNIHHLSSILVSLLILMILIELVLLLFYRRLGKYIGIISLVILLLCLSIFGEVNNDKEYAIVFGGLIFFALIQLTILLLSSRTPKFEVRSSRFEVPPSDQ
jgi:hypothetical protein